MAIAVMRDGRVIGRVLEGREGREFLVAAASHDNLHDRGLAFAGCAISENRMPAIDDDDRPKKKVVHDIGQDLTLLSVQELNERIGLLHEEIARLEADIARKQATRSAADQFFKR
jgi:uncharacterized small protein (DUF1192 family)